MGGANLEVFRVRRRGAEGARWSGCAADAGATDACSRSQFALYVALPLSALLYFGMPGFKERTVMPRWVRRHGGPAAPAA